MASNVETDYNSTFSLPKPIKRLNPIPNDSSEVYATLEAAEEYAANGPTAYVGQIIFVQENGKHYSIKNTEGELEELGSGSSHVETPDWNQNDSTANDYIKNRTHYVNFDNAITVDSYRETSLMDEGCIKPPSDIYEENAYYRISFDWHDFIADENKHFENIYKLERKYGTDPAWIHPWICCGNMGMSHTSAGFPDTGETICFTAELHEDNPESLYQVQRLWVDTSAHPSVSNILIEKIVPELKQLDEMFIPSSIARTNQITNNSNIVNGSTVGSLRTIGSTSENSEYTMGHYAFAEGGGTMASGNYSHAEGSGTTASGPQAHAEGSSTLASGTSSHAEGYNTQANHKSQHVFGECNIVDNSSVATTERGNYIEIVGNGTSASARSNARTLDWNGNEVLAGDLTINGTTSVAQAIASKITNADLTDYTYNKSQIDQMVSAASHLKLKVVFTLPTENIDTDTIYLVPRDGSPVNVDDDIEDVYDEYIYVIEGSPVESHWEKIGQAQADLSEYLTINHLTNEDPANNIHLSAKQYQWLNSKFMVDMQQEFENRWHVSAESYPANREFWGDLQTGLQYTIDVTCNYDLTKTEPINHQDILNNGWTSVETGKYTKSSNGQIVCQNFNLSPEGTEYEGIVEECAKVRVGGFNTLDKYPIFYGFASIDPTSTTLGQDVYGALVTNNRYESSYSGTTTLTNGTGDSAYYVVMTKQNATATQSGTSIFNSPITNQSFTSNANISVSGYKVYISKFIIENGGELTNVNCNFEL